MLIVDSIDYQYFNLCAVQIGYAKRISIECKPLETNDLSRKVHCSNIVIFRYIFTPLSNYNRRELKIFFKTT